VPVSCGKYRVLRRNGEAVGDTVMHDAFAEGFSTVERLGDHPCPEDPATPGPLAKAVSWVKAEASRVLEGDVPDNQYQERLKACRACPKLQAGNPVGWCGACGCGTRRRAELSIKAKMPRASCPLSKW
jgi:hypothetical protein